MSTPDYDDPDRMQKKTSPSAPVARAELDRDALKSLFHLFVGKPDSTIQIFDGPFEVGMPDLKNLNENILEKIKTHGVTTLNSNGYISFSKAIIQEFASIQDMLAYSQNAAEETEDITLKWDFLLDIAHFEIPQRHTMTVRIGRTPNPKETLRRLFNSEDDGDPHDLAFAPMYCRVDYINPRLGKELLNIVKDWRDGLRRPMSTSTIILAARDRHEVISSVIQSTLPLTFSICSIAFLRFLLASFPPEATITVGLVEKLGIWLWASIATVYLAISAGKFLATRSEFYLRAVAYKPVTFSLTNGDQNRNQSNLDKSNKNFRKFLTASGWAILLNIIAAYIAFRIGIGAPN